MAKRNPRLKERCLSFSEWKQLYVPAFVTQQQDKVKEQMEKDPAALGAVLARESIRKVRPLIR